MRIKSVPLSRLPRTRKIMDELKASSKQSSTIESANRMQQHNGVCCISYYYPNCAMPLFDPQIRSFIVWATISEMVFKIVIQMFAFRMFEIRLWGWTNVASPCNLHEMIADARNCSLSLTGSVRIICSDCTIMSGIWNWFWNFVSIFAAFGFQTFQIAQYYDSYIRFIWANSYDGILQCSTRMSLIVKPLLCSRFSLDFWHDNRRIVNNSNFRIT